MHLDHSSLPHAEAQLLLALARTEISAPNHVDALLRSGIQWTRGIDLAVEHEVVPFVYYHLKSSYAEVVPSSVLEKLRSTYLHQSRRSLQIQGELPRLLAHLDDHGIDALPFKGPALAALAYREENLRTFTDLDLLVHKEDVERTVEVLTNAGFEEKNPLPATYDSTWDSYIPLWHSLHENANGYVRDEGTPEALHVDIHWGLASRYFRFPMEPDELWGRRTPVTLDNGTSVYTFSPEDTLLFQCMHAAKDAYYRLSQVCDIAELLRTRSNLDLDWTLQKARTLRCRKMVLLGLKLSHDLLEAPLPAGVRRQIREDETVVDLSRRVTEGLFRHRHGTRHLLRRCLFYVQVRDRTFDGVGAAYNALQTAIQTNLSSSY